MYVFIMTVMYLIQIVLNVKKINNIIYILKNKLFLHDIFFNKFGYLSPCCENFCSLAL